MKAIAPEWARNLSRNTDVYATLVRTTIQDANKADDVNAQFISRHNVLKDIYLFNTTPENVQIYLNEVAA